MKKIVQLLLSATIAYAVTQNGRASEIQTKIQSAFGDRPIMINDYDSQLKEVAVDSKTYFATHDGRYLFAGPIFDTERRIDIVSEREDKLRKAYLSSLPEDVFVSYPSKPSKYQITVITDIDCPYCRKFHNHMASFNQRGISVNYIMMPRTGVESASYKKTVAALCSDSPAKVITSAMQNHAPNPINCEPKIMNQHMEIARSMKINSTPTIVLPSGKIELGLRNPDQLIALLEGDEQ